MTSVFTFTAGNTPLLVSIPHTGTLVPGPISDRFTPDAHQLPDTDWFVDRLYQWVTTRGAGLLAANYSRYVVDLNRSPDDIALYSGHGTGLLPNQTFAGRPIYLPDMEPDKEETSRRLQQFWLPYHQQIDTELQKLKERFGYAVLLDAHSIISEVPMLFAGTLPDLNLGSFQGASADPGLVSECMLALSADAGFSTVLDGRFKGGYITRNYGCPENGMHALQLEIAQSAYMREPSSGIDAAGYDEVFAGRLIAVLQGLIETLIKW